MTLARREFLQLSGGTAHSTGDAVNAVLAAAGYNFRRRIQWLRLLLLRIPIVPGLAAQLKAA